MVDRADARAQSLVARGRWYLQALLECGLLNRKEAIGCWNEKQKG